MRLRSLATAAALAVAAVPFLTSSASSADTTIGQTLGGAYADCSGTVLQTQSAAPTSYTVPNAGVITSYRVDLGAGAKPTAVALKLARAGATAGTFTIVGTSDVTVPAAAESFLQRSVRVPARAGDVIGIYSTGAATCRQFSDDTRFQTLSTTGNAAAGSTVSGATFAGTLNLAATVEPDVDGDGFGDTTQDKCATDATTQGVCAVATSPDTTAPDTTITSVKAKKVEAGKKAAMKADKKANKKAKVTVTFTSTEAGSTFACSVDGAAFKACTSPFRTRLTKGKHTFAVKATDAAGNTDATPATATVKIKVSRRR